MQVESLASSAAAPALSEDASGVPEAEGYSQEAAEEALAALSDTLVALQLLKAQFPRSSQVRGSSGAQPCFASCWVCHNLPSNLYGRLLQASVPLLLRSQVYSLVQDHTAVDQELDSLRCASNWRSAKLLAWALTIDKFS